MYVILSGLCAGAFAALCAQAVAPATTEQPPAEFVPVERDLDITTKLQEMFDGHTQLCQRNIPDACTYLQVLTTLRGNLYFTSQRCAQAEPQDCDLYALHRADVLASHDIFKKNAAENDRLLSEPTAAELRTREEPEAQKRRDDAFKRRMEALEKAHSEFLRTIP